MATKKTDAAKAAGVGANEQTATATPETAQANAAMATAAQGESTPIPETPVALTAEQVFPLVVDSERFVAPQILAFRVADGVVHFVTTDGRKLEAPLLEEK